MKAIHGKIYCSPGLRGGVNLSSMLPHIDWSNPDVQEIAGVLGEKYNQQSKIIVKQDKIISEQLTIIAELQKRVQQLEESQVFKTKSDNRRYNIREDNITQS